MKILNKIPVVLRLLILIFFSIALGIAISWAYVEPTELEPKLSVVTSILAILLFGLDLFNQINPTPITSLDSNTTSYNQTHLGDGDNIVGDKIQGDKVTGNKIVNNHGNV